MIDHNTFEVLCLYRLDPTREHVADFGLVIHRHSPRIWFIATQCLLTKRPDNSAVRRRDGESADIARMIFVPTPGITLTRPARIAA